MLVCKHCKESLWYSTTSAGYGVTWKVAEVVKRVSKACSDNAINEAVERAGFASGCFQQCGPHSTGPTRNTSDTCWVSCFEETVSTQCHAHACADHHSCTIDACRMIVAGIALPDWSDGEWTRYWVLTLGLQEAPLREWT